ncbi:MULTISPECIES: aspartate kinase [Flavobacteriaceae]|uniref:Aspartokinase n=2 Tax=Flavobacteriaceae TaxID=49546 RepID=A0A4Y8ATC2_9FLAO|nr:MULTISPECIES: aspartate kinase [Flavobacteriaceae]TEW74039.1 aspartate kinase [Gramella jeungdoensis]GGK39785.1 aspartokinase [Lutibacter litoralis]
MKVYKFGGASVKDAESIRNVVRVLKHEGFENTLIIISAMGKMTNAFEKVVHAYYHKSEDLRAEIEVVRDFHIDLVENLFEEKQPILVEIELLFGQLSGFLAKNKTTDYNFIYDQVVGYGELLSTKIISSYLNIAGITNNWIDVRDFIKTDSTYRNASVNWQQTCDNIKTLDTHNLYITQGFLGSNSKSKSTTLGREGSDYSAAIFAFCLNAESVTIWKDVDGVLNADPRYFEKTILLKQISYSEAIEMAFYGASVIHPKTLKPLENKKIPLNVRSFYNLENNGSTVSKGQHLSPEIPCFILKREQILVSISALDFSFMVEHNLSDIFRILHDCKLKVNLIQNSALSFSVCLEDKFNNFDAFLLKITPKYNVTFVNNVSLYTIRHANQNAINLVEKKGTVLLKQATKGTVQLIMQ